MNDIDCTHLSLDSFGIVKFDEEVNEEDWGSVQNIANDFWSQNEGKMIDDLRSTKTVEKKHVTNQY